MEHTFFVEDFSKTEIYLTFLFVEEASQEVENTEHYDIVIEEYRKAFGKKTKKKKNKSKKMHHKHKQSHDDKKSQSDLNNNDHVHMVVYFYSGILLIDFTFL